MFMGKTYNNQSDSVSVNTQLFTSFSDTCMVRVGAWNDKISLKFAPAIGVNPEGLRQYATNKTDIVTTSLTMENATALLEGIKEHIIPALEKSEIKTVSVAMGSNNTRKVLSVATDDKKNIKLILSVGVNEQGVASQSLEHQFSKKNYMVDYNPSTGEGQTEEANAEFMNFVETIKQIHELIPTVAHSIRYDNESKKTYSNNSYGNSNSYTPSSGFTPSSANTSFSSSAFDFNMPEVTIGN